MLLTFVWKLYCWNLHETMSERKYVFDINQKQVLF